MNKYDVIIIGAGPAGAFLAYKLKNKGISVLLLEKEIFPRYKSCAGGLTKKAYDILYAENINIERIVDELKAKGVKFTTELNELRYEDLSVPLAVKYIFFEDPSGIPLEIVEWRQL